jgi:FkbM family methyltransferase
LGDQEMNGTQIEILPDCNVALIADDNGVCSWVRQCRRLDYDRGMLDPVIPFIKPGTAVVDVGAFVGTHTAEYLKHAVCVVSFEPNPAAFACLAHNCPKAIRFNVALGDKHTKRFWTRIVPNCGASYLSDQPSPDCLTVPVRPLDSFQLPPSISYMKIDAEGEETVILRGGRETIMRHRPVMLIEVNKAALNRTGTSEEELLSVLHEYGYATKPIWPGTETSPQWDVIAIPKG